MTARPLKKPQSTLLRRVQRWLGCMALVALGQNRPEMGSLSTHIILEQVFGYKMFIIMGT